MSKKFAVLGYPVAHSLSPLLHNELFRIKKLPYSYEAVLMPPEDLENSFPELTQKYVGFNCTIPLKEKVIPLLEKLHPDAAALGSVNTVLCGGENVGFSTDADGFLRSLEMHGIHLEGKKILIVGCGGVARVIALTCAKKSCNITIALRSPQKAATLCDEIRVVCGLSPSVTSLCGIQGSYDLLVQCTPVGMYPNTDACPVSDEVIANCGAVFDTVYNPIKTQIVQKAEALGKPALSGLEMLVFQGLASEEIWLNLKADQSDATHLISILSEKLEGSKSIALVGFMACGKSTIGKALANELGYTFIDTDAEVELLDGRPIPQIFEQDGEALFRKIETDALKRVVENPRTVIATGGGIVSTPENIELLKKNCFVVFLDIPFDIMAERASLSDNRPLFRDRQKAYALWRQRYELYNSAADLVYDNHCDIVLKSARVIAESYRTYSKKQK